MSLITPTKNINGKQGRGQFKAEGSDYHRASAHNPIFQKELYFVSCPYCADKVGRKKNFKRLWSIYMHVQIHHAVEKENFSSVVWNLADFVMRGILK